MPDYSNKFHMSIISLTSFETITCQFGLVLFSK